jgi:transposase
VRRAVRCGDSGGLCVARARVQCAAPGSSRGTLASVGQKLGVNPETLRDWVEKAEIDSGQRPGTTSDDKKRIAELEKEVRELRRANEILKAASAYFARELDPRLPR